MAKEPGSETIDSIAANSEQHLQVVVDDAQAPVVYCSTAHVGVTAEEITLDIAGPLRQAGPNKARLKIDQRLVMTPWAAKRLALGLNQALARYEQLYGTVEIDPRRRMVNQPTGQPGGTRPA